jgi:two-component system CheB/CheR fusion protein
MDEELPREPEGAAPPGLSAEEAGLAELIEGQPPDEISSGDFSIVGIGASAGGLEAMTELLRYVLPDSMAYVIVQHLAPNHESIMAEILSRSANMSIYTASDGMKIEPNTIYVNPPNADLKISDGHLRVTSPQNPEHRGYPIDTFFRSLAEHLGGRSIGVILSGTGSDGTLGLKAIKAVGGITFAQDPGTARYDGMPRSAIESGFTDFSLPPIEIANRLTEVSHHPKRPIQPPHEEGTHRQLFRAIRKETGIDLS